jgi:hypothetical protein
VTQRRVVSASIVRHRRPGRSRTTLCKQLAVETSTEIVSNRRASTTELDYALEICERVAEE